MRKRTENKRCGRRGEKEHGVRSEEKRKKKNDCISSGKRRMRRTVAALAVMAVLTGALCLTACDASEGTVVEKHVGVSSRNGEERLYVVVEGEDGKTQRFVARTKEVYDAYEIGDAFSYNFLYWLLDGSGIYVPPQEE